MYKNLGKKILLSCVVFLFGIGIAEITLRLRAGEVDRQARITSIPGLLDANAPNNLIETDFVEKETWVVLDERVRRLVKIKKGTMHVNSWGFRGADFKKEDLEGKDVVLCVGDSTTFGIGVQDHETYAIQLESMLKKDSRPNAFVVNAGVRGYNVWEDRATFDYYLPILKPKTVILGLYMNDNIRWSPSDKIRYYVQYYSVFFRELGRLYAVCNDLIQNRSSVFESNLATIPDPKSREAFRTFASYGVDAMSYARGLPGMHDFKKWSAALENVVAMKKSCDEKGIRFICVIFPCEFQLLFGYEDPEPQKWLSEFMLKHDIEYGDMRPIFQRETTKGNECYFSRLDAAHFNSHGHYLVASWLKERLAKPNIKKR